MTGFCFSLSRVFRFQGHACWSNNVICDISSAVADAGVVVKDVSSTVDGIFLLEIDDCWARQGRKSKAYFPVEIYCPPLVKEHDDLFDGQEHKIGLGDRLGISEYANRVAFIVGCTGVVTLSREVDLMTWATVIDVTMPILLCTSGIRWR